MSSHAFHVEHTGLPEIPQKDPGTVGFFPIISFAKLLAVSLLGVPLYPGTQMSVTSFHSASATRSLVIPD
jgi:phage head maturation protease